MMNFIKGNKVAVGFVVVLVVLILIGIATQ